MLIIEKLLTKILVAKKEKSGKTKGLIIGKLKNE